MKQHRAPGVLRILEKGILEVRFNMGFDSVRAIAEHFGTCTSSVYILFDEFAEETGFPRLNLLYFAEMAHKGRPVTKGASRGKKTMREAVQPSVEERLGYVKELLNEHTLAGSIQATDLLKTVVKDMRRN